jgi:hypothetical protein
MKVVGLLAARNCRFTGNHFRNRINRPHKHSAAGRITSIKIFLITLSGVEPAIFQLVAYCLDQVHNFTSQIKQHLDNTFSNTLVFLDINSPLLLHTYLIHLPSHYTLIILEMGSFVQNIPFSVFCSSILIIIFLFQIC